jgi:hypothetical protein
MVSQENFANAFSAFAKLGIPPCQEFLGGIESLFFQTHAIKSNIEDYCKVAWSLAVFDSFENDQKYKDLHDILKTKIHINPIWHINNVSTHRLATANLWFNHSDSENIFVENSCTISKFEKKLSTLFNEAGFSPCPEKLYIPALNRPVDDCIMVGDQEILIEADGPYHYLSKLSEDRKDYICAGYNGSTYLQTGLLKLLKKDSYLLRVDYRIAYEVFEQDKNLKDLFARKAVEQILQKPIDAYMIIGESLTKCSIQKIGLKP